MAKPKQKINSKDDVAKLKRIIEVRDLEIKDLKAEVEKHKGVCHTMLNTLRDFKQLLNFIT